MPEDRLSYCMSCGVPLSLPDMKGRAEQFCKHCGADDGELRSREEILRGIATWLKSWQPSLSDAEATKRAEHYMKAMPAWADK